MKMKKYISIAIWNCNESQFNSYKEMAIDDNYLTVVYEDNTKTVYNLKYVVSYTMDEK